MSDGTVDGRVDEQAGERRWMRPRAIDPATVPSNVPNAPLTRATPNPTASETRPPYSRRDSWSRPSESVPSQ